MRSTENLLPACTGCLFFNKIQKNPRREEFVRKGSASWEGGGLAMLALFFALGRFLAAFCVLAAFVLVSGRFFCILERSTVDFGGVKDAPGRVLEAPTAYFSKFFSCLRMHARWRCPKTPDVQKQQFFSGFS